MGIDMVYDPDPSYELTADNVKKMMAIYMRFRYEAVIIIIIIIIIISMIIKMVLIVCRQQTALA
jgi:uncharacterized protein YqhQ